MSIPAGAGNATPASAAPALEVRRLGKTYASGHRALDAIDLEIRRGEIFALLGPNGAGKTTLISMLCGIVTCSEGMARIDGHDIVADYRAARERTGLVPQELTTDAFETVWRTVRFSRGLFGKPPDDAHLERVLRDLALWEKRNQRVMTLSGGMKRRLLIAKALAHEPTLLFLDEPTAGVDVELRHGMWEVVRRLREQGTTIVLTTHYIDEAELMADRVGVINGGRLLVVEDKHTLMQRLGGKRLTLELAEPLERIPETVDDGGIELVDGGHRLVYHYDAQGERTGITALLTALRDAGVHFTDLHTEERSLEEIFVSLVRGAP